MTLFSSPVFPGHLYNGFKPPAVPKSTIRFGQDDATKESDENPDISHDQFQRDNPDLPLADLRRPLEDDSPTLPEMLQDPRFQLILRTFVNGMEQQLRQNEERRRLEEEARRQEQRRREEIENSTLFRVLWGVFQCTRRVSGFIGGLTNCVRRLSHCDKRA
jgi:hypothetical protein